MQFAIASRTASPVMRSAKDAAASGVVRLRLTCGNDAIVTVPADVLDAFEDMLGTIDPHRCDIVLAIVDDGYRLHTAHGGDIVIQDGRTTYVRPPVVQTATMTVVARPIDITLPLAA